MSHPYQPDAESETTTMPPAKRFDAALAVAEAALTEEQPSRSRLRRAARRIRRKTTLFRRRASPLAVGFRETQARVVRARRLSLRRLSADRRKLTGMIVVSWLLNFLVRFGPVFLALFLVAGLVYLVLANLDWILATFWQLLDILSPDSGVAPSAVDPAPPQSPAVGDTNAPASVQGVQQP